MRHPVAHVAEQEPARPASAVYSGAVMHQRLRPRRHHLRYRMFSLLLDLDELPLLHRRLRWFSLNRFNLFSLHECDHGDGSPGGLSGWVRGQLRAAGLPHQGSIHLLTMPRILGFVFNPISVYFCHDADGVLRAILYEVNSTFGERHGYLIEVPHGQDAATAVTQSCAKRMHVSPFIGMAMEYRFRVWPPRTDQASLGLCVEVEDAQGRLLVAHYQARRAPLADRTLLALLFSHPLLTLKVVGGIHWEALKLWSKGVKIVPRPAPAPVPITVQRTAP